MTIRLYQWLQSIGLATCGKGGARLAARLSMPTSRQTILRRIMEVPEVITGSVLYLGIDDFAFRRGFQFGTILVNLESHRVVDLFAVKRDYLMSCQPSNDLFRACSSVRSFNNACKEALL